MEYYGNVEVLATSFATKNKYCSGSIVAGSGSCSSNDLEIARNLSEGLTGTVDHALGYAHDIHKRILD